MPAQEPHSPIDHGHAEGAEALSLVAMISDGYIMDGAAPHQLCRTAERPPRQPPPETGMLPALGLAGFAHVPFDGSIFTHVLESIPNILELRLFVNVRDSSL
jgi:hypothetical protein